MSHDARAPRPDSGGGADYVLTSESVTEGHPDKLCDLISDTVLDACLAQNPGARVACEALAKGDTVIVAGEVSGVETLDFDALVRGVAREIGYTDPSERFSADTLTVKTLLSHQAAEIDHAVTAAGGQGAGDQGTMFGYATRETPELMPLPILLAHRLARALADDRRSRRVPWLRPDGKTQVSVRYSGNRPVAVETVLVSTQHATDASQKAIEEYVRADLGPRVLGSWFRADLKWIVNPSGSFAEGGPAVDCGLTGRKIIVDTYGGAARHGGGAFSGKDPSKVDRSGAYYCRWIARQIVAAGLAERAEVQVGYAIGQRAPVSVMVETFGTGDRAEADAFVHGFEFFPDTMVRTLDLLRPIYRRTTNYGHFGKADLPWEEPAKR